MPLQATLLTKSCEARRLRLNESASVNFITPASDLLHTSDRLINSRRFIDESIRKSESFIAAIIIPCIGTASTCRERQ